MLLLGAILTTQVISNKTLAQEIKTDSIVLDPENTTALMPSICDQENVTQEEVQRWFEQLVIASTNSADINLGKVNLSAGSCERAYYEKLIKDVRLRDNSKIFPGTSVNHNTAMDLRESQHESWDEASVKPAAIAQNEEQPSESIDNQSSEQPTSPTTPQNNLDSAPKENYSVTTESYYYNWSDNFGNSGSQFVFPVTVTFQKNNFDVGLRTAYINSNFDGVLILDGNVIGTRKGSVSTISDTSLSLAYTFKESSWPIRLNLDMNLPTGKATLVGDEKNAIMDGSLVQQTRFGEGFNIAPGISISRALSNRDVIGLGVSHIFRGQFDPNGDVINDEIDPGNETVATLQYQHLGQKVLFIGGLIYTNYGLTKRGGLDYYRSGDRLDANATVVFVPFQSHRVQLSGRYFTQVPNDVVNFLSGNLAQESANSNGNALFLSFDWGVALDKQQRHTVRLLGDYLTVEANSYDRINDLYNAGRNKFSVGLGYDYAVSDNSRFSVQAKYFTLTENATPITQRNVNADGFNLYGTMNFSF